MTALLRISIVLCAAAVACALGSACNNDVTEAVVVNGFPAAGTSTVSVYKVWYRTTLWLKPIPAGMESETLRIGTGTEPAYAILAVGLPAAGGDDATDVDAGPASTPRFFLARTRDVLATGEGESKRIVLSPTSLAGPCASGAPLSREEYALIAARIFPGDVLEPFNAECTLSVALPMEAGAPEAGVGEGGADAGRD